MLIKRTQFIRISHKTYAHVANMYLRNLTLVDFIFYSVPCRSKLVLSKFSRNSKIRANWLANSFQMRFMNTRILPMMIVNCQFARKMLSVHVLSGFMESTFRLYMVQYTHTLVNIDNTTRIMVITNKQITHFTPYSELTLNSG